MNKKTTLLTILDGWGHSENEKGNAIKNAKKPNWDNIWKNSSHTLIEASGLMVGVPKDQMGNSEVGHINIGAGRVVEQELVRINNAIDNKDFENNTNLNEIMDKTVNTGKNLHIMGLISPGGVHSHEKHICKIIEFAINKNVKNIYLHAFLDGRDVAPKSALSSIKKLDDILTNSGKGSILTISGRYYAMDRDNRWDRIKKVYFAMVHGIAKFYFSSAKEALEKAYARQESDEFVEPSIIKKNNKILKIENHDTLIFMNFRADRARQISYAFLNSDFSYFDRQKELKINFLTLTKYSDDIDCQVIFEKQKVDHSLGEVLAENNLTQLRIAETEKYAHVTFFFNGGREAPFKGEERCLIDSPKVKTYDLKPEMSAYKLTDELIRAIESQNYDVIICNYANADMVGHTGNYLASLKAIEAIDECLGKLSKIIKKVGGQFFITADHGNADEMLNLSTGDIHTAHTTNPVPFIYQGPKKAILLAHNASLSDIAPTLLESIGIKKPQIMTGKSIFKFTDQLESNND